MVEEETLRASAASFTVIKWGGGCFKKLVGNVAGH